MALVDQFTLASDATFQGRVRQAIIAAAIAIVNESMATGYHSLRAKLAKAVMNNPGSYASLFAMAVAGDAAVVASAGAPPVQVSVTDANINNAVSAMWNSFFSAFD